MSGAPPHTPPQSPPPDGQPHESTPPESGAPPGAAEDKSVGELVFEISEQASILVREEIELAKTEISDKLNKLLTGSVVALVAGVFLLAALILIMHGIAILLGDNVFGGRVWLGYLVEAAAFILLAVGGGLFAYRSFKKGSPPIPEMAIEEAKEIRATLDGSEDGK